MGSFIAFIDRFLPLRLSGSGDTTRRVENYFSHWNNGNFAAMYSDYLNKETKDVFGKKVM